MMATDHLQHASPTHFHALCPTWCRVWDLSSGKLKDTLQEEAHANDDDSVIAVDNVAVSPDGKRIVSMYSDDSVR